MKISNFGWWGALALVAQFAVPGAEASIVGRRPGAILYELKDVPSAQAVSALGSVFEKHGMKVTRTLVKGRVNQVKAQIATAESEEQIAEEMMASGAVKFAEPDYLVEPAGTATDPYYGMQWHHTKINSPAAWDYTTGNSSVSVVVCDTGIESTHPDLAPNLKLPGLNTVDNTTNTAPITSHGTFVAGVIGAVANNGQGGAGVAWNVKILPGRISNATDGSAYYSDMAECITWGADQGAKVANLSYDASGATIDSAAQYIRAKGGLLVMSAGNNGTDISSTMPDYPSFLLVGATDQNDAKTSWSNYGSPIDIVAPGQDIISTYTGGGYASGWGTSFSAPMVTGVAALIYSVNPGLSAASVEGILLSTATDLGSAGRDVNFGYGRLNAGAALAKAGMVATNHAPVAVVSASVSSGVVPLTVSFDGSMSYDLDGRIMSHTWNFGDGSTLTASGTPGSKVSHVFNATGTYTVTLTVVDDLGASSSASQTVVVNPMPAKTMFVSKIMMTASSVSGGYQAQASVTVMDASGKTVPNAVVSGTWTGVVSGSASGTSNSTGAATLNSPKSKKSGTFTFTVTGVSLSGYTYDSSKNAQSSGSITK